MADSDSGYKVGPGRPPPRPNSPPSPSPRASGERAGPRPSLRAGRKFAATRKIDRPIDDKARQIK